MGVKKEESWGKRGLVLQVKRKMIAKGGEAGENEKNNDKWKRKLKEGLRSVLCFLCDS